MKKFLALYRMDMDAMKKRMETADKDAREKGMAEWDTWMKKHTADFADMGGPTGKNTEVSAKGSAEKSNDIGGYSVVKAETKEAAAAIYADSPHFKMPGALLELMEVVSM